MKHPWASVPVQCVDDFHRVQPPIRGGRNRESGKVVRNNGASWRAVAGSSKRPRPRRYIAPRHRAVPYRTACKNNSFHGPHYSAEPTETYVC